MQHVQHANQSKQRQHPNEDPLADPPIASVSSVVRPLPGDSQENQELKGAPTLPPIERKDTKSLAAAKTKKAAKTTSK